MPLPRSLLLLVLLAAHGIAAAPPPPVWPLPHHVSCTGGGLPMRLFVGITVLFGLQPPPTPPSAIAQAAAARGQQALRALGSLATPSCVVPAGRGGTCIDAVMVNVTSSDETLDRTTDYAYTITFPGNSGNRGNSGNSGSSGSSSNDHTFAGDSTADDTAFAPVAAPFTNTVVSVTAASPYGVAYALETLAQLAKQGCTGAFTVSDAPDFPHRGLMIDTGRRFYSVPLVESVLEGMAAMKMNVLHMFLSELCFRVESKVYVQ